MGETKEKGNIVATVVMLVLGFIFVLPILLLVMNSFKPYNDMIANFLALPTHFTLDNYKEAVARMDFVRVFLNSAYVTGGTVIVGLTVSFFAAYGIAHIESKDGPLWYILFTLG